MSLSIVPTQACVYAAVARRGPLPGMRMALRDAMTVVSHAHGQWLRNYLVLPWLTENALAHLACSSLMVPAPPIQFVLWGGVYGRKEQRSRTSGVSSVLGVPFLMCLLVWWNAKHTRTVWVRTWSWSSQGPRRQTMSVACTCPPPARPHLLLPQPSPQALSTWNPMKFLPPRTFPKVTYHHQIFVWRPLWTHRRYQEWPYSKGVSFFFFFFNFRFCVFQSHPVEKEAFIFLLIKSNFFGLGRNIRTRKFSITEDQLFKN